MVSYQHLVIYHESVMVILSSLWFLVDVRIYIFKHSFAYLIKLIVKLCEA